MLPSRMACVYLVLQLIIGVIIENIELLEKIENMKVSQKHLQVPFNRRSKKLYG